MQADEDAELDDLIKALHLALVDVFRVLTLIRRNVPTVRAADLSLEREQFQLLELVERFGPIGLAELAGRVGGDLAAVSRRVASLEEAGLMTLQAGAQDGQAPDAAVTPGGKAAVAAVDAERQPYGRMLFAHWDRREVAELVRLFQKFAATLDAAVSFEANDQPVSEPAS